MTGVQTCALPISNITVFTSCQPRLTCSPSDKPDPEKSRVKTVIFDGRRITTASLASALHPLHHCTCTYIWKKRRMEWVCHSEKKKRMFKKGLYDCKPYRISCSDSSIHKNWHTYFRGNIQHKEEKYLQAKEKVDNDYTAMYSLWNSWATSLKKRI